jgi:hypothetical protein
MMTTLDGQWNWVCLKFPTHTSFLSFLWLILPFESTTASSYSFTYCTAPVPGPTPITPAPTVATASPTAITENLFPCNICREGGTLTRPNAIIFTFGITPFAITCGQAQAFGNLPGLTLEQCGIAQALARDTCGCPFEPTPAPAAVVPATPAPTVAPPTVFCTVCFNGTPSFSNAAIGGMICGSLDVQARNSEFTSEECLVLQTAAAVAPGDPCQCLP